MQSSAGRVHDLSNDRVIPSAVSRHSPSCGGGRRSREGRCEFSGSAVTSHQMRTLRNRKTLLRIPGVAHGLPCVAHASYACHDAGHGEMG